MPFDCGSSVNEIVQKGLKNRYLNAASNSIITAIILVAIIIIIVYVHVRNKITVKEYVSMTFYISIFIVLIIGLNSYIAKSSAKIEQEHANTPIEIIKHGGNNITNPKYNFQIYPNLEPSEHEVMQNNYHQGFNPHDIAGYRDSNPFTGSGSQINEQINDKSVINDERSMDTRSYISSIKRHSMPSNL